MVDDTKNSDYADKSTKYLDSVMHDLPPYTAGFVKTYRAYVNLIKEIADVVISSADSGLHSVDSEVLLEISRRHQVIFNDIMQEVLRKEP